MKTVHERRAEIFKDYERGLVDWDTVLIKATPHWKPCGICRAAVRCSDPLRLVFCSESCEIRYEANSE